MGIDGTCAIAGNLNIILLSKLATEKEVGLYSAATQMMVPLLLVYQSIAQSIFPVMCRKIEPGLRTLRRISEQAMEVLLMLAVPTIAGIFFLGQWALSVLYKNPTFVEAVPALHILSWMLVLQVFSSILGQVLVATHREKLTLKIALASAIVNLGVGWPLILRFGLRGALLPGAHAMSPAAVQVARRPRSWRVVNVRTPASLIRKPDERVCSVMMGGRFDHGSHGSRKSSINPGRSFLFIALPVCCLDVVRVVIPPRSSHSFWILVVRRRMPTLRICRLDWFSSATAGAS